MSKTILVIDDNQAVCATLELLFGLENWSVLSALTPKDGLDILKQGSVDLVIQDMNFSQDTTSGDEGVALFSAIREESPDMPVVLLTAWTDLETAIDLVRSGASDYLGKPWDDQKMLATARNLLELSDTRQQLAKATSKQQQEIQTLSEQYDLKSMVFADPATTGLVRLACQVAQAQVPILITGPNGAGKERIAQLIHANSGSNKNMVAVNCGALPKDLMEAELFGAEAGAYTGATKMRLGRFEAADGGTLFLDEIGNLSLEGQMKILRVLETGEFERLGSNQTRKVNVRLISATNADLSAMIEAGDFREDLYYRLNLIELKLPPLAERAGDILPLARYFLSQGKHFSFDAEKALTAHHWPGNVRELRNCITRAELLCQNDEVSVQDLGLTNTPKITNTKPKEPTKEDIETALANNAGVIADTAAQLGLSRQALYRRMDKYKLR